MSSALEKKATWSPEEFEPLVPPTVKLEEVKFPEPPEKELESSFSLPASFWEDLWKDPVLSVEFERYIEDRVNQQVKTTLDKEREQSYALGFQQGKDAGFAVGKSEGMDAGYKEAKEMHPLLQSVIKEVISEKENLIKEHEKEWAQALVHTIQKLQVKEPELFSNGIKKWVSDRLMDFPNYTKVRIFVSKNDFEKVELIIKKEDVQNCEIIVDVALEKGQIRCDCGDGGVFFSKADGFKLLDAYLDENFH